MNISDLDDIAPPETAAVVSAPDPVSDIPVLMHELRTTVKFKIPCDRDIESQGRLAIEARKAINRVAEEFGGSVEVTSPFVARRVKK